MSVGTTALRMTTVTRTVYCDWSMMPCCRPKSEDIVPKVSPVDMSSVV